MKSSIWLSGLGLLMVFSIGCGGTHSKPNFTYMPNMAYTSANKAQEPQDEMPFPSVRTPVEGTIPRGFKIYPYTQEQALEARRNLRNPLPRSRDVLARGKVIFNRYCIVCHGEYGEGDGSVVPAYPAPPTLQSKKIKDWLASNQDGAIYHIITRGQGRMGAYASQVDSDDRWSVVHYIRALHRAKNPSKEDLKRLENW